VGTLRAVRRSTPGEALVAVSGVDPLNLAGYVTPGETVAALTSNRIVYRDGVPLAARDAGGIRPLADYGSATTRQIEQALVRRTRPAPSPDTAASRVG
jgi:ATP-dependent Lhr-like helicase